jgi:hypothetical protein
LNSEPEGQPCDAEAARLLPWYLTGRLAADESARVAQHVEHCATCRDDLLGQRTLRERVRAEATVEMAPQAGLAATLARIDELDRELDRSGGEAPRASVQRAAGGQLAGSARRPLRLTQWLAAAVVVQAIGLALVGRALLAHQQPAAVARYQTLASAEPAVQGAAIRAVFAKSMTTEALRTLLRAQHLGIVAGPSEAGVFTLGLEAGGASAEAALRGLRADPMVEFAEPTAAAAAARP